jgi:uncharacterized protein
MNKENPCFGCDLCCKHVALEIDTPEDKKDYEQIRWYLVHKDVLVFIDHDDSWNLQFNTPCEKLEKDSCSIYNKRPSVCRGYSAGSCEKYGEGNSYKLTWKNLEEFEEWLKEGKIIPE